MHREPRSHSRPSGNGEDEDAQASLEEIEAALQGADLPPEPGHEPGEIGLVRRNPSRIVAVILILVSLFWLVRTFL
jgi:hypothetical protein